MKEEDGSDKSSVSSQEGGDVVIKKEELCDEIDLDGVKQKSDSEEKKVKKSTNLVEKIVKDEPLEEETEIFDASKKTKETNKGKKAKEERMLTRPRRDSSSSLAAATELKAKKDEIGEPSKPRKDSKKEMKKIKVEKVEKVEEEDKSDTASNGSRNGKSQRKIKKKEEEVVDQEEECNSDLDNVGGKKKKVQKKKGGAKAATEIAPGTVSGTEGEEPQHLKPSVECSVGDKIKVFWQHGLIYEAKINKVDKPDGEKWPKYYVHYQGWNQRHDEWITRGKIAENLTWNANPKKVTSKSSSPPPEKVKGGKSEKRSSDEEEKRDSDEKTTSEEEKDVEVRRKTKSVRSSTPSSTPGSSRTSSPAHNKRTKSPAPKRPNSPKEKTPLKDKKSLLNRTNSPAQRKSPILKRQSSRNSLNKQSDDDFEMSEADDEEEKGTKKVKAEKEPPPEPKVELPKRSLKAASTPKLDVKSKKAPPAPAEVEKEEEKKVETPKPMRSRRSATPTPTSNKKAKTSLNTSVSEETEDPYVFQEPEPMEPFVKIENISAADIAKHSKAEQKESTEKETEEVEKTEENNKEKVIEVDEDKVEEVKLEVKTEQAPAADIDEPKLEIDEDVKEEVKEETEDNKEEKSDDKKGPSYDRYALFPHLVSLKPGQSKSPDEAPVSDPAPEQEETTTLEITSANIINSIVEKSILKETSEPKPLSPSSSEKNPVLSSAPASVEEVKDESKDEATNDANPPKQRTRSKKSRKNRNLRNPTHISREVVSDSDSDSDSEKLKPKPVTPRRKVAETEKAKTTPKRIKEMDSDDEEQPTSKRAKKRNNEDDDDSLVCEETLPGSPVQSSPSDMSSNKTSSARDERNPSSRVDMPFASVASAAIVPESGNSATKTTVQPQPGLTPLQTTSLKNIKSEESPPATPESANSVDSPLTRSRKEDGRKSPAESSEVDLDSLSGRGKAGSEDSRMDVECSSSSDTRTRPGRRRPASTKDVEKGEDKLNLSAKRKRKSRGDTNSRGRGKGRGRNGSGVGRGVARNVEESDDSEKDNRAIDEQKLERLDNAALADLAKPKPNSTSKYNFYVMLSKS